MPTQLLRPPALSRLCTLAFEKMRRFRNASMLLLKQYTGRFYNQRQRVDEQSYPLNYMHQAVTTMVPNLVFKDPKARITSRYLPYREYAGIAELAVDHLTEEIALRETLRRVVTDSIFLGGFVKIGLGVSGQTLDINSFLANIGQAYCKRVSGDDMIIDPVARAWEEQRIIGNRFQQDRSVLLESGLYDPDAVRSLSSRYGGPSTREASTLSGSTMGYLEASTIRDLVDLVEVWLPKENLIVTMPWHPGDQVGSKFLRIVQYNGPEAGPYRMLGYAFVPDNILPVAPAMIWADLHALANKVARKATRQALRQKSVLAYESAAWQGAQDIVDADDGTSVRVNSIEGIKEVAYGGVSPDAYKYLEWAKINFSEMAMNIDLLSGTGTNEPTATQAELLQANASVRLADMQSLVYQFTGDCLRRLFFYLHTDPLIELPLIKRVAGQERQVVYSPEMREGDWSDYMLKVRPYSMARQDPNLRVRRMLEFCGNVIPALAQAYQMLGPAFNIENALNVMGREMGIEELDELINSPALHMQMQRMIQAIEAGIPISPKVISTIMKGTTTPGGQPALSMNPQTGQVKPLGQPNPLGQMQGGIGPGTEMNMARHETEGELQSAYGQGLPGL